MSDISVLIVEDEFILAMSMEEDLIDRGYFVTGVAASASDAVDLARRTRPDVILMDIRLKGEADGVDAAQQIHAGQYGSKIIFVTASREPATLERIEKDHPAAVLFKPVAPEEVDRRIRSVLEVS